MTELERQKIFMDRIDASDRVTRKLANEAWKDNDHETFWMKKAVLAENERTRQKAIAKFSAINA